MLDKTVEWLVEENNPSVRYRALTELKGLRQDDELVVAAKQSIMEQGKVPEILGLQNPEGFWGDPERFYRDKYKGTVWTLLILSELNASTADSRIRKACEFILENSFEPLSGGFSYDRSARTGTGLPSGVIPCLTGNMAFALIRLGYLEDPRVRQTVKWIINHQRTDDGNDEGPKGKTYQRYEMCWGRHTCHMGAVKTLKALNAIPVGRRSDEERVKIGEIAEYFLKHRIYKKSHHPDEISRPGWLKLGFPLMYQSDVLEILEMFADLEIEDPRLDEAVGTVKGFRQKDWKWKLQNTFNGKTIVGIEQKGEPSKWITLRALKVLKAYDEETRQAFENLGS